MENYGFQLRVTGILLKEEAVLLVKQRVSAQRQWSLPGGRVEHGESLEQAMIREMREETGLETQVVRLLYVCDVPGSDPPVLHLSFLLRITGGHLGLPTNEWDANPIEALCFVPFHELESLHFGKEFIRLCMEGFPNSGQYLGNKANIGL